MATKMKVDSREFKEQAVELLNTSGDGNCRKTGYARFPAMEMNATRNSRSFGGSPRITQQLHRRGYPVGHNRVARLMRANGLNARQRKKFRVTTISDPTHETAANVLNREFRPARPNQVWASDATYIATAEGWLYLFVIIDLYSRRVVGWAMSRSLGAATAA